MGDDGRAAVRRRLDLEGTTHAGGPLPHPRQPDHPRGRSGGPDADAVVFDDQDEVLAALFEQHVDREGARMLGDVVQRFLRDAIDGRFQLGCVPLGVGYAGMEQRRHTTVPGPFSDVILQHLVQAKFVERRGSQFPGEEIEGAVDLDDHL